jgi:hypothetical protein
MNDKKDVKEVRELKVSADSPRLKRKIVHLSIRRALVHVFVPLWIVRFIAYNSKKALLWNNALQRKSERTFFLIFCALAVMVCPFVAYIWLILVTQNNSPGAFPIFWASYVTACILLNPFSTRWLHPDYSELMLSPKRFSISIAPDAINASFPIGWAPEAGWVRYGFYQVGFPPEFFPRQIVIFGDDGNGQEGFALGLMFRMLEVARTGGIVLVLDPDAGGLDFSQFKDVVGVSVYSRPIDCAKALHYSACIVRQRRRSADRNFPNILIIADGSVGNAMIGKNQSFSHLTGAINTIVQDGKKQCVHVAAFPMPEHYYAIIPPILRYQFDRAQFFTRTRYKIKQASGEVVERQVETPYPAVDLFLWDVAGNTYQCKSCIPNQDQIDFRLRNRYFPSAAFDLWKRFMSFDFPDLPTMATQRESKIRIGPGTEHLPQPREAFAIDEIDGNGTNGNGRDKLTKKQTEMEN